MSGSLHTKKCIRCGEVKPLELFYAHPSSRDGYGGACKECVKAGVRANYRANRDHYVAYDKRREQTAERKEFKDRAQKKHRSTYPAKYRARLAVSNALRSGKLARQPCQRCGSAVNVHAHHHDYSKPLDVHWLCKDCHWLEHGSVASEAA